MKIIKVLLALCFVFFMHSSYAKTAKSICFYYNEVDSVRELINFDRVVLDPANVTPKQIQTLKNTGVTVYAYLSVGEFDENVPESLKPSVKSHNDEWDSAVMDVSDENWHKYLEKQTALLKKAGFEGLFLDTLDSYYLYADEDENPEYFEKQVNGLKDAVEKIHKILPNLIFNRGFEIFPRISFKPKAIAFESLYKGYNASDNTYTDVSEEDRKWLLEAVKPALKQGVEVIAIDYLDDTDQKKRTELAKKIAELGFTPYVSDGMLYGFGTSYVYCIPKRVLTLYDGRFSSQLISAAHTRIATPLEYLGYAVDTVDINSLNYSTIDKTRYAALVTYFDSVSSFTDHPEFDKYVQTHIGYIPMLFLGTIPQDPKTLNALGMQYGAEVPPPYRLHKDDVLSKGLLNPHFSKLDQVNALTISKKDGFKSLVYIENQKGNTSTLVFKAPWGGVAVSPYPVESLNNNTDTWLVDPFVFLDKMLNLPKIVAADATTESGRRILTSHVDGDGFPSRSWFKGTPLVSEVLFEHVFKGIDVPHTVSIIQGEIAKDGLYPKDSNMLEDVARKIFELPNVEIASHTFSHPFNWDMRWLESNLIYGEHLNIPGYKLDYNKEMKGSIDYINTRLAPKGKKVKVFLWSGDANPTEDMVVKIDNLGIQNLNGGNTTIKKGEESLTNVSPTVCWYKDGVQVYAPQMNENVYTNEWTEHYDGFARAKETYELTGSPRRLKTISIYYHMYSGTYEASLKALTSLYDYALSQEVTPLFISDYARRARTLYETGLSKDLNGTLHITSTGIRSIRVPKSFGYPVSSDIVGFNDAIDGYYMILNKKRNTVRFTKDHKIKAELKSANGIVEKWNRLGSKIEFAFKSYVPLTVSLWSDSRCQVVSSTGFDHTREGYVDTFSTDEKGLISGTFICNQVRN